MDRVRKIMLDEPLIPFAIIGGVLFVVNGFSKPNDMLETIEVRPATLRALEQGKEELVGRSLSTAEREDVIEGYLEEEVLVREAFRMDLEKKDSRVRKRLINVMRSTLDQAVAEPTRAELEAYFRENRERYAVGERLTIDQVFFASGSENEPDNPGDFLDALRGGADHTQLGDDMLFIRVMRAKSKDQLRASFGGPFAEAAFLLPSSQWHGPIESPRGMHFLKVVERLEAVPPSFDELEDYLREDWMFRKRREIQSEKIAEMRKRYRIVFIQGK